MDNKIQLISEDDFNGHKGDSIRLDISLLKQEFQYIGLWFACDRNEDVFITTVFFESIGSKTSKPAEPAEEIPENSFKKTPKKTISTDYDTVWIATRREQNNFCRMKIFPCVEEKSFINFKVIKNRGAGFNVLGTGIIRGDSASFYKIGIEDGTGALDYNDTILFLVLIRSLPPVDWKFDTAAFSVQGLPMSAPPFLFSVNGKYSSWLGQNPLESFG